MRLILSILVLAASLAAQTTINGGRTILGPLDASGASSTKSVKTGTVAALPATCGAGELYWATNGPTARKLYTCEATNTWVQAAYTQGTSNPATCTVGDIFFDTDATAGANLQLCTATNTWTAISGGGGTTYSAGDWLSLNSTTFNVNPIDPRYVVLVDEFCGTAGTTNSQSLGQLRWRQAVSGSGSSALTQGTFINPCLITITTGATSGNAIWFNYSGSTGFTAQLPDLSNNPWEMIWVFKFPASSDYANVDMKVGIGYTQSSSIPGGSGFYLRFDTVAGDTTFKFVSRVANTEYTYDSGVSPDTSFHTLRLYSNGSTANKVYYQLDGGTERTACSAGCDINNITTMDVSQGFAGLYTRENAAKNMTVDYFAYKAKVGSTANRRN